MSAYQRAVRTEMQITFISGISMRMFTILLYDEMFKEI